MAYREVAMWEILNVLRRVGRGESQAAVGRVTGHDRKTVRGYVRTARQLGWVVGEAEPTEELASAVYRQLRPAREREPGQTEDVLLPHKEQISAWLKPSAGTERGLRLTKVHQLLARRGVDVAYSSLHRFAVAHCGFGDRRRVTVRVADTKPGEVAEIDFGRLGLAPDPSIGRRRTAWALVVTLVYSRHQYLHIALTQKVQDVITGLEDAWAFFGGTVRRIVIDNLTPAVKKADRYDPIFQRTFEEYARYRGIVLDATVVRHATGPAAPPPARSHRKAVRRCDPTCEAGPCSAPASGRAVRARRAGSGDQARRGALAHAPVRAASARCACNRAWGARRETFPGVRG